MDLTQLRQDIYHLNQPPVNETCEYRLGAIIRCNGIVSSITKDILSSKPEDRDTLVQALDDELLVDVFQTMEREFDPSLSTTNPSELYAIYTMLDITIIDLYTQNSLLGDLVSQTMAKIVAKCKILDKQADTKSFRDTIQMKLMLTALLQLRMLVDYHEVINIRRYIST